MSGSTICGYLPPWIAGMLSGMSSTDMWVTTLGILILLGVARAIDAHRGATVRRAVFRRPAALLHQPVHSHTGSSPPDRFPQDKR